MKDGQYKQREYGTSLISPGRFTKLGAKAAEMHADESVASLGNLKIQLMAPSGAMIPGDQTSSAIRANYSLHGALTSGDGPSESSHLDGHCVEDETAKFRGAVIQIHS